MQYLVSAENTNYHWWQLELLIESFNLHGLEDDLVVAIAQNESPKFRDFTRNIRNHKRIFNHENYGQQRNYLPLNKAYAAMIAYDQGIIKEPFCLIEPDMVLVSPVPLGEENVGFQLKWLFGMEYIEENGIFVKDYIAKVLRDRNLPDQNLWFPVGSVYTFNNVPKDLFMRVISWTEKLECDRMRKLDKSGVKVESWWHTSKVGWVMAMLDYYGMIGFQGHVEYEMSLLDHNITHNFIHYNNGLPPVWSKYMYKYEPPDVLCMGGENPFDVMLGHNPTTSTNYFQKVIKSYLDGAK